MHRHVSALAVVASLGFALSAHAQQQGYSINHFDVSERGSEWFATDSLDLRGEVRPAIGVVGEWAYRPLVVARSDGDTVRAIVRNQFVLHPGASLVLFDRLRLAVDLPIQAYADGHAATVAGVGYNAPADKASIGDLRLGAVVRLFGKYGDVITGAFGAQIALPTGSQASYSGDGTTRITPHFLIAGDIAWFVYAARLGVTIRTSDETFANTNVSSYASFAASAGVRLVERRLVIGPEFFMRSVVTHDLFFKERSTPMEGLLGLHFTVVDGLRIGAGIGAGLTSGYGAPDRRGLLSIEWVPPVPPPPPAAPSDRDHDNVIDDEDACPDVVGVPTADPRTNGCPPPPPDRDHDGVLDANDACPDEPGEPNADATKNGCPPPPDRDHDGVLDAADACPDEAGEPNADATKNGCPPPPDRDHDTVLDADDACPDQPGNPDPNPKRNGCPRAYVQGDQIKILDQVKFKTNSSEILPGQESEDVLQAVLGVLGQHAEVVHVRVEGHTDSTGSLKLNRRLSQDRAQSVVAWLVTHGIEASRLTSVGFGPDQPIDSNDTDEGRRNNRRVEFHIEGPGPLVPAEP
jgi:OOP family OmpA-OmpF porin